MLGKTLQPLLLVAVVLGLLLGPRAAFAAGYPTIYDNYQNFPVGSRASGMGGAYTALACDEAALHYNPAALGCAEASHLELAANAYLLNGLSIPNGIGRGQDISATTFHSIPSIVGGVRVIEEGDPITHEGRMAFGVTVSVPRALALQVDASSPTELNSISFAVRDDVTAGDVGLGIQLNRYVALGLSLGVAVRTAEFHQTSLVAAGTSTPCDDPSLVPREQCTDFALLLEEAQYLAIAGRLKLGARFTPTPSLSFGVAVTSPTVDLYGFSRISETFGSALSAVVDGQTIASWGAEPARAQGQSSLGFPLRVALGAAYSTPKLTLSIDASLNLPRRARVAYDLKATPIHGAPPADPELLQDIVLVQGAQPNVNLGAEFQVLEGKVLDVGLFTDLSSVEVEDAVGAIERDRVNMFGGSLAIGILGGQSRSWVGASFAYGQAQTKVPSGVFNLEEILRTGLPEDATSTITRWTLGGMIGANYSFLPERKANAR